jgi:large subunit ribosomal protein L10
MPTAKKVEIVKGLNQNLKEAKSFVISAYQGLKTSQVETLKKEIEKDKAKLLVAKNTLINIALKEHKIEVPQEALSGPTALLLNFGDGVKALKSFVDFAKKIGPETLKIKVSYFEGKILDAAQTVALSALPAREVLAAKILGLMNSPIANFVTVLKADQRKLVTVLSEIAKKK